MKNIGENVYEQVIGRMTEQPSGTARSLSAAVVGHNQGLPLEPYRATFIPEYSPSLKAATELPQEKGTYEQMRKMMLDREAQKKKS